MVKIKELAEGQNKNLSIFIQSLANLVASGKVAPIAALHHIDGLVAWLMLEYDWDLEQGIKVSEAIRAEMEIACMIAELEEGEDVEDEDF